MDRQRAPGSPHLSPVTPSVSSICPMPLAGPNCALASSLRFAPARRPRTHGGTLPEWIRRGERRVAPPTALSRASVACALMSVEVEPQRFLDQSAARSRVPVHDEFVDRCRVVGVQAGQRDARGRFGMPPTAVG